jgi:hypothetical protein
VDNTVVKVFSQKLFPFPRGVAAPKVEIFP